MQSELWRVDDGGNGVLTLTTPGRQDQRPMILKRATTQQLQNAQKILRADLVDGLAVQWEHLSGSHGSRFSSWDPQQASITKDFVAGLFKTRNKDGDETILAYMGTGGGFATRMSCP